MFLRALFAFLALPGVVAGVIPVLIALAARQEHAGSAAGFLLIGFGLFLLLWCVRDFYVSGKGTLAPWHPPERLAVGELYRHVRNPMLCRSADDCIGLERCFWLCVAGVVSAGALGRVPPARCPARGALVATPIHNRMGSIFSLRPTMATAPDTGHRQEVRLRSPPFAMCTE
jgi:hypothetical protein